MKKFRSGTLPGLNIVMLALLFLIGCSDIIEKDVSGYTIKQMSPGDSVTVQGSPVTLKWEAIDAKSSYRLQLCSPNFDKPIRFLVDTLISATKFEITLVSGTYQWQVRAENTGSYGAYSKRTFTVDSVSDLSKQQVKLRVPLNQVALRDSLVSFQWDKIEAANEYSIVINKLPGGEEYFSKSGLTSTKITVALGEGSYEWKVRALNDLDATSYSDPFTVTIDRTAPAASIPSLPKDNEQLTFFPLSFSWTRVNDPMAQNKDSLLIYLANGGDLPEYQPVLVSANTYSLDSLPNGVYQWKLRTIDPAGNQSGYSTIRQFTVQR